jgi:signal recognition particle subunit SRP54
MKPEERANPALMNPSRKRRIAAGAGVDISEVNKLTKMLDQMKKMMKQFGGQMPKAGRRGKFKFPFSL